MGRGWLYVKHCEKRLPLSSLWSNVVFEKEVILHEFYFETSELDFEASKSSICLSIYYFTTSTNYNWSQIFTGMLFNAYVEIHQMRRLLPIVSSVFKVVTAKLMREEMPINVSMTTLKLLRRNWQLQTYDEVIYSSDSIYCPEGRVLHNRYCTFVNIASLVRAVCNCSPAQA